MAPPAPASGRLVLALTALRIGFVAVHTAARRRLGSTLVPDESEQVVFAQDHAPGYNPQPPPYAWLAWPAMRVLGPTLLAGTTMKRACVAAVCVFAYRCPAG